MDIYAIELGSSNISIFKKGYGIVLVEPSILSYVVDENEKKKFTAFGKEAKNIMNKTTSGTRVVCPVECGAIQDLTLAIELLNHCMNLIDANGRYEIVFVIDIGLTQSERDLFKDLGYAVGARNVKFIYSGIAGLMGAGFDVGVPSGALCVDLGGGKCSVSAVSLNSIIEANSLKIGGGCIDKAISIFTSRVLGLQISSIQAEKIRKEVGSLYDNDTKNIEINGTDVATRYPRTEFIESSHLYETLIYYFNQVVDLIKKTIEGLKTDLLSDICNNGIYVVGGLALTSGLENFLLEKLNLPVYIVDNAEYSVILGAGKLINDKSFLKSNKQ